MDRAVSRLAGFVGLLLLMIPVSNWAASPASAAAQKSPPNLIESVKAGDMASLRQELRAGSDPNLRDAEGMTALHYAAYRGNVEAAKLLAGAKADLNARDSLGLTPLHAAAFEGRIEVITYLLRKGAAVGAQDSAGNTPLHYAALNNHTEAAEALLACGADPKAANAHGRSPAYIAQALGNRRLIALFENVSPNSAAGQNPASGADSRKAARTYTDQDLAALREKSRLVFQEGGPAAGESKGGKPGGTPPSGALGSAEAISDAYAQIDSLTRERRDIESRLPSLQKSCDDFKQREGGSGPISPNLQNSLGTDLYNQYQAVRERDKRVACEPLTEARDRLAAIDGEIASLRETISEAGTSQKSTGER